MHTSRIGALAAAAGAILVAAACGQTVTSASGTATGGTGTGGFGGTVGCAFSSDCPPTPPCVLSTCTAHVCGTVNAPPGTLGQPDAPGDCHALACDGEGHATMKIVDDSNLPPAPDPCHVGTCAGGVPGTAPAPKGTPCSAGGLLCDGAGSCDLCTGSAACTPPLVCGAGGTCIQPSCFDGIKDGTETDVDCGGGFPMGCVPCGAGRACLLSTDCLTGHCCGNTCLDVSSDPNNCGSCGHGCAGAPCSAGACVQPPFASGQSGPYAVAVDAAAVYWTNRTGGTVMRCPVSGCNGSPTVLASGQLSPGGIATDGASVYWTNAGTSPSAGDGAVMRCAAAGCNGVPSAIAVGMVAPDGIAVLGGSVYWSNNGTGPNNGSVMKCPVAGCGVGQPTQLASGQFMPSGIAVDSASAYWIGGGAGPGTVVKCAVGGCGGQPTQLAVSPGAPGSQGLALDAAAVFWGSFGPIFECAVGGCNNQPSIVSSAPAAPFVSLATDGASLYWTSFGPGAVVKCPVAGCNGQQPTAVIPGAGGGGPQPYALAVDTTSVYWANMSAGTLVKAPK